MLTASMRDYHVNILRPGTVKWVITVSGNGSPKFGADTLLEPMQTYCQLGPQEETLAKF